MNEIVSVVAAWFLGVLCTVLYLEWNDSRDDGGFGGGLLP